MSRSSVRRALPALGILGITVALAGALTGGMLLLIQNSPAVPESAPRAPATSGATTGRIAGAGSQGREPQFKVECGWSHAAANDPIVYPGDPGASHQHDFFGNVATDAHSTAESLRGGDTTCANKLDTAAYWAPRLRRGDTAIQPIGSVAYYRPGQKARLGSLVAYPPGLMMVAGNPNATSPQALEVAAWHCGASPLFHAAPPTCPEAAPLAARIAFPDCWDGEHTDSDDHRSHVAYSTQGRCPPGRWVPTPQLIFEVQYPVTGDPSGLSLTSGDVMAIHADFLNAWDQKALEREVRACLNRNHICGVISNRATG